MVDPKKFKVSIESVILYDFEIEAPDKESALRMVSKKLEIEEARQREDNYYSKNIKEAWYQSEEAKEIIGAGKTTTAYRTIEITDGADCPYCGASDNTEITLVTIENGCTIEQNSTYFETNKANGKIFTCKCWKCEQIFNVDYFKEV